ncbi:MAG: IS66 family transposase [Burkholderiales bacterium]
MHARWRTASREELIAELEDLLRTLQQQQREIERLRREQERADRDRNRYRNARDVLRKKIERLEDLLDRARRETLRQAAPFSRGAPRRPPRRPGRKPGAAYGPKAHRAPPTHVDAHYEAPLPPTCPDCGGPLALTGHATQHQEDLPIVRPIVRAFHIAIGQCTACHRRVQGRHPLQTSDALGAAGNQLGPVAVTWAVILNKQFGVSLGKVARLFRERFGLTITCGGLVHAMRRAGRHAEPTYETLGATIRGSPVVTADETGWKVDARLQWLWAYVTPDTTVYKIQPGRGFEEAAAVLGANFGGVLVRDGWAPYRRFDHAIHQTCLAHLLRRCRTLIRDHHETHFAPRVQAVLQRALQVRDRAVTGDISAHGRAVARGHLLNHLNGLLDRPGRRRVAQKFAAHLAVEFPAIFTFLLEPDAIDATNWRAEHALRPAVVTRKICGGNRSTRGAHTQEILASVLRTIQQRNLDAAVILPELLRSPQPRIALAPPATVR